MICGIFFLYTLSANAAYPRIQITNNTDKSIYVADYKQIGDGEVQIGTNYITGRMEIKPGNNNSIFVNINPNFKSPYEMKFGFTDIYNADDKRIGKIGFSVNSLNNNNLNLTNIVGPNYFDLGKLPNIVITKEWGCTDKNVYCGNDPSAACIKKRICHYTDYKYKVYGAAHNDGIFHEKIRLNGTNGDQINVVIDDPCKAPSANADLSKCDFSNRSLKNVLAEKADFTLADLTKAIIENSDFNGSKFNHTVIVSATLKHINVEKADFTWADLTEAIIEDSNFNGSKCEHIGIAFAIVKDSHFDNTNCADAYFVFSSLEQVTFKNANLRHANFGGSKLINVDFTGADLSEATINGKHCAEGSIGVCK